MLCHTHGHECAPQPAMGDVALYPLRSDASTGVPLYPEDYQ